MKTINKTKMFLFFNFLGALLHCAAYKACYMSYKFDGINFSYKVYFKARWYSPLYILYMILGLILGVFSGGLLHVFQVIYYEIVRPDKGDDENSSYSNQFKEFIPMWKRKLILFRLIYQY